MGNMGVYFRILVLAGLLGIPFAVSPSQDACAGIATQSCDPQVWKALQDRAELETQREVMQNQNLIFKPDSVLHYTCFERLAAHAAATIGPLFTHSTYFGGVEQIRWEGGAGYIGMGDAMDSVVEESMRRYVTQGSFNYHPLGGRGQFLGMTQFEVIDIPQRGLVPYACSVMQNVWQTAKCLNFVHNATFADTDGYYPFKNLIPFGTGEEVAGYSEIFETRRYPIPLACPLASPFIGDTWASKTNNSLNVADHYYVIHLYNRTTFAVVRDHVQPGITCSPPIETGVTILLTSGAAPNPDAVCPNPGCTYVGGSCVNRAGSGGGGADDPDVTGPS